MRNIICSLALLSLAFGPGSFCFGETVIGESEGWFDFSRGQFRKAPAGDEKISRLIPGEASAEKLSLGVYLPGMQLSRREFPDKRTYTSITAPGAGIFTVGSPDLPVFGEFILIPNGSRATIEVNHGDPLIFSDLDLPPLQPPPIDSSNAPDPPFTRDAIVYNTNKDYPGIFAHIEPTKMLRGQDTSVVWLYPYHYNPVTRTLFVYPDLSVTIHFFGEQKPIPARLINSSFDLLMRRRAINAEPILSIPAGKSSPPRSGSGSEGACDYLIITHSKFKSAADTLAAWKRKAGLRAWVTVKPSGSTAADIRQSIQNAYDTWNPAPSFVLLIGDSEFIPTNYFTTHPHIGAPEQGRVGTDLYYGTVDGSDYFPDIFVGRLSVDTLSEATNRVNAIISYERNPVTTESFYENIMLAAYFQDYKPKNGYADRRFAQTAEDLALYFSSSSYLGEYSVDRFYFTEAAVTPSRWGTASYNFSGRSGDPGGLIPSHLKKPGFAWDGNSADISSAINSGRFLAVHRDHGARSGWGDPYYRVSHVNSLANGNRRPVVWTINCQTGWFDNETDDSVTGTPSSEINFSEAWERNANGGAVGVIGATRVSWSGHNDRIVAGWTDAIWPGYLSDYSGRSRTHITPDNEEGAVDDDGRAATRTGLPNLLPYKPSGWDDKIVVSSKTGTRTDGPEFIAGRPIYVDYAYANISSENITATFYNNLMIDGKVVFTSSRSGLNANTYSSGSDRGFVVNTPGFHRFEFWVDKSHAIAESDENDNGYSRYVWFEPGPIYRMGEVLNYGKIYYSTIYSESTQRKVTFELFHYFGDPAMMIRTESPVPLSGTHPTVVEQGRPTDLTVTIEKDGSPVYGATVTISRPATPSDYWVGTTNGSGRVTFPGLSTSAVGTYDVVATAANCDPYEGTIQSKLSVVTPTPGRTPPATPTASPTPFGYQTPPPPSTPPPTPVPTRSPVPVPQSVPFTENFDAAWSGGAPADWSLEQVLGTTTWKRNDGGHLGMHPDNAHGGSYNALFFFEEYDETTRLVSPPLNFGSHTDDARLVFWHAMEDWQGDQDELRILYRRSVGSDWTLLTSYTTSVGDWIERIVPLPSPGNGYYVCFQGEANWGWGVCIDDVTITYVEPDADTLDIWLDPSSIRSMYRADVYTKVKNLSSLASITGKKSAAEFDARIIIKKPDGVSSSASIDNWEFAAAQTKNLRRADYLFDIPGNYTVTVEIYDSRGKDDGWPTDRRLDRCSETFSIAPSMVLDDGDYDGDWTDDIALFRSTIGLWAIRGVTRLYFGSESDIPVSGDYNNDGTSDIGLYRASSGLWAIRGITRSYFGGSGDCPVPGDYDGDGFCDMGIYRRITGLWAIQGVTRAYFGGSGDTVVPGDYNGDGKKDIALFRPSSGLWALRDVSRIYFGSGGDLVVPGDYTGTGPWSPAIFRNASGLWAVRGVTRVYFGSGGDRPIPADLDGDGAQDTTVFRGDSGLWASRGVTRVYFGASSDLPVTR